MGRRFFPADLQFQVLRGWLWARGVGGGRLLIVLWEQGRAALACALHTGFSRVAENIWRICLDLMACLPPRISSFTCHHHDPSEIDEKIVL